MARPGPSQFIDVVPILFSFSGLVFSAWLKELNAGCQTEVIGLISHRSGG